LILVAKSVKGPLELEALLINVNHFNIRCYQQKFLWKY